MLRIQGGRRAVRLQRHGAFFRATAVSCGMHAAFLGLLVGVHRWSAALPAKAESPIPIPAASVGRFLPPEDRTWVELAPGVSPAIPAEDAPQTTEDHAAVDRGKELGKSLAPRIAIAADILASAPDRGENAGRLRDPAFRRDTSTLHARLTDGSSRYRPEQERTDRVASSPEAMRRENEVGMGDSSRTRHHAVPDQRQASSVEVLTDGEDEGCAPAGDPVQAPHRRTGRDPARGEGALDAEAGERSFDTIERGLARDTRWVRAASDEKHPGLMDLSAASAPGPHDGTAGRGPGEQPGAIDRVSTGVAPSPPGDDALAFGDETSRSAAEQLRVHYEIEIRRRVARALHFPRRLALMLEQGETIIAFTVGPDGRLEDRIHLLKSAGFEEFDAEALAAVTRAAPFPATGRRQSVSMRIPFLNPVVLGGASTVGP